VGHGRRYQDRGARVQLSALRYTLGFTKVRYGKEPTAIAANLEALEGEIVRYAHRAGLVS
jgi:hypothetical protein